MDIWVGGAQAKLLSGHVLAFSRAGAVRRVGAHRQLDRDGLEHVCGFPWQWDPAQGDVHPDLKVRWLAEKERFGQDGRWTPTT